MLNVMQTSSLATQHQLVQIKLLFPLTGVELSTLQQQLEAGLVYLPSGGIVPSFTLLSVCITSATTGMLCSEALKITVNHVLHHKHKTMAAYMSFHNLLH